MSATGDEMLGFQNRYAPQMGVRPVFPLSGAQSLSL